jgi:hypothetical protein
MIGEHARGGEQRGGTRRHRLRREQVRHRRAGTAIEEHVVTAALMHHDRKALASIAYQSGRQWRWLYSGVPNQRQHRRCEPEPGDALHLCDRGVDAPGRDHRCAAEARRSIREALGNPVVVDAAARLARARVGDVPHVEPGARVHALARDPVAAHDLESALGIGRELAQRVEVGEARGPASSVTCRAVGSSIPIRAANCATDECAGPSSGGSCDRIASDRFACQSVLGSST